ncbi:hypothetical protein F5141DRAFT_1210293 [Pisolithus sp. B1]|nr:hypothetical protein F5141DRAFT_1210293 [Pisolithus sp. B1]
MALPLELSYVELQNAKDIESICLEVDGQKYDLTRNQDTFSKAFHPPLTLGSALSFSISRNKPRLRRPRRSDPEIVTFSSDGILPRLRGQEFQHLWGKVSIKLVFERPTHPGFTGPSAGSTVPANIPAPASSEGLQPTTQDLIAQCPRRFPSLDSWEGVGKSTLINQIFGVETASVAKDRPGEALIEQEFTSPQNDRLILHDSKGFEPADGGNYETVRSFIERRKNMRDIKDQLHAVWLCFQMPIPTHGERLLEDGTESFLRLRNDVLGNTPTIVVFTKHDRVDTFMRHKMRGDPEAGQRYLQEFCIQPIQHFTGDKDIAHVAVSSKPKYVQSLEELIRLTQEKVSESFTSPGNQVSPVPLAAAGAQRMLPTLKVNFSIDVGKQRYWKALGTSANFWGHTMRDCLAVIHTDIVSVWNFYDPCQYLDSKEFRDMMMHMVERVDAPVEPNLPPPRSNTLRRWVHESYQRLQDVPKMFMAYIVDLTHVLEILFSLTARMMAKQLTRTAIKLAYKAYYHSEWMTFIHTDIRYFQCSSTARDEVLQKITSMIPSYDRVDRVSRALQGMPQSDLEKDEEWAE